MTEAILPALKPLPVKDRLSILFVERGQLDVLDGAFVLVDKNGVRQHIPVGSVVCLMLEPGTRVSHAAVTLAARVGCLLAWVGEGGVRLYSAGQPGGARADRLLYQARLALDDVARLKVVRKMYEMRFQEKPRRSAVSSNCVALKVPVSGKCMNCWQSNIASSGMPEITITRPGGAAMFLTGVCQRPRLACTGYARRAFWLRGMLRQSALSIPVNRSHLFTISLTFSNLRR